MSKIIKKIVICLISILSITGLVAGVNNSIKGTSGSELSEGSTKEEFSGSLVLNGSTSVSDVANALTEAFANLYPYVSISVGGNGSGEGAISVKDGTSQIGMLSRDLKDSEEPEAFNQYIIGYDGIAIIVHPTNEVRGITQEQASKIFAGEIKNWKDLGGKDASIQCIGREVASGTRGAFEEILRIEEPKYVEEQNATGNVKSSVAGNPNAIGYITVSARDESISALKINEIEPTFETVKDNSYPIKRPFLFITLAAKEDSLTQAFLAFVRSPEGQNIVAEDGVIPAN